MNSSSGLSWFFGVLVLGLALGVVVAFAIGHWPPPEEEEVSEERSAPGQGPRAPRRHRLIVPPLTAVGFVLAYLAFGPSWKLALACAFVAVMILIAFIDFYYLIIPNRVVLPAAAVGLAGAIALEPHRWWHFVVAAFGSSLFLFVLALIWPGGMGMGDVKLALLMGGVLAAGVLVGFFLAFFLGAAVGLTLILTKRKTRKDVIPFGPYLALGSVLAMLYGPWLVDRYLALIR